MTHLLAFIRFPRYYAAQYRAYWLRPLVIVAVLLSSAALAYKGSTNQIILLLILLAGSTGTLALLRWPPLGLLLVSFGGLVIPYVGPAGFNASMAIIGLMLVLWLGDMFVRERRIRLVQSQTVWPLLGLVGTAALAFIIGQFSWLNFAKNAPLDAQLGGFAVFALSVAAFFLVSNQVRDLRWLQLMTWTVLAFGSLYVAGRIAPGLLGPVVYKVFQGQAIGGVFYAWLPALAFSQFLFNHKLHPAWRGVLGLLVVATLYTTFVQNFGWKSGWLPAFTGVVVIVWLRSWQFGLLLSLIAAVPVIALIPDFLSSDAYSVSTRLDAWLIMLEIIKINPLLGLGFGNYYWYTPLFGIRGWTVTFNSHNNYVDIVAQTGLLGLACFLWFFGEVGRLGCRLRGRVPDGFPKAYVNGALGGLVATLVAAMLGDWVLPFVYNIGLAGFRTGVLAWLFLGGLVALENMYENPQSFAE